MIAVLENYRDQLLRSWNKSGIPAFLSWWYAELVSVLPDNVREVLEHPPEQLLVIKNGGELEFYRQIGEDRELLISQPLPGDAEVDASQLRAILDQFDEDKPRVVVGIESDSVLTKNINFPAAATENLRQVIGFEMDRHTPFKAGDVYYDCSVLGPVDAAGAQVSVELALVPRERLNALLTAVRDRGLVIDAVDILGDDFVPAGRNLLPLAEQPRRGNRRLRLNLALAAVVLVLLYGVMWQSVAQRESALDQYQQRLEEVRKEARSVADIRKTLEDQRAAKDFLKSRRQTASAFVEVLNEVTNIVPEDTWLQRLQLRDGELQLTGQAPESSRLIQLLGESEFLREPSPRGSIPRDPQTGKERFTIEAVVQWPQEDSDGTVAEQG